MVSSISSYCKPITSTHLLLILSSVKLASSQDFPVVLSAISLSSCSSFIDTRSTILNQDNLSPSITIPKSRMTPQPNSIVSPVQFTLATTDKKLRCSEQVAEIRKIPWEVGPEKYELTARNFLTVTNESSQAHLFSYFTSAGYFYDNTSSIYYRPNKDYCVESLSDDDITLKVCTINNKCSGSFSSNTPCIPKCCAIDEVLHYWSRQCVRIPKTTSVTPWIPPIFQGPQKPHDKLDITSKNYIFRMTGLPSNCNNRPPPIFKWHYSSSSPTIGNPMTNRTNTRHNIKLVAPPNGENRVIRPMLFILVSRHWQQMDNWINYCVEGFYVNNTDSPKYTGNENDFVIFHCDKNEPVRGNSPSAVKARTWSYVVTCLLAMLFLLVTIFIYLALWTKQNLHGLITLSYTVALFGSYLFLTIAQLVFLFPNAKNIGLHIRGGFCYGNAVLSHFFFLAYYTWLMVMNFDLWLTFSSMRTVKRDEKEWRKFGVYSLLAWMTPLIMVIAFAIVDEKYRDPLTEVPVPNYATSTCFVSPEFRGQYVYIPMGIMLGANLILICITMKIFIEARHQTSKTLAGSNTSEYSLKLFCKLFVVMGGTSLVDFLTWYYNNAGVKPWPVVVVENISYLLPPVAMFIIFGVNDRTIKQLRETYPKITDLLQRIRNIFTKQKEPTDSSNIVNQSSSSNKTGSGNVSDTSL